MFQNLWLPSGSREWEPVCWEMFMTAVNVVYVILKLSFKSVQKRKMKNGSIIQVCVWMFEIKEEKTVRTGVNEYICVDGWIPRCFRVYNSNLLLSRKHSAEITVWKDTVLSAEGERDSGTMECHCYSCQEHFSHAPGAKNSPNRQE